MAKTKIVLDADIEHLESIPKSGEIAKFLDYIPKTFVFLFVINNVMAHINESDIEQMLIN